MVYGREGRKASAYESVIERVFLVVVIVDDLAPSLALKCEAVAVA
jgi:hypothetical protein